DGETLDPRGQRDRPRHAPSGTPDRIYDLAHRLVEQPVVVRFKAYADLVVHPLSQIPVSRTCRHSPARANLRLIAILFASDLSYCKTCYLRTLETTPAPTVRPPSRIAKRSPSSIATGVISSPVILMLSPGITISVPSGRLSTPVTSVVRK